MIADYCIRTTGNHFNIQFNSNLTPWAEQGVLLLNRALTVREGSSKSHYNAWLNFTNTIIELVNEKKHNIPFVLIGSEAREVKKLITKAHTVIETYHPAYNARREESWDGKDCFNIINEQLRDQQIEEIKW